MATAEMADDSASYYAVDPASIIRNLEVQFWRHAALAWIAVPIFALSVSELLPYWRTTCAVGFNNWTLVPILLVEAHHLYAESVAWSSIKSITAPPEWGVLRQYGVLRLRWRFVALGILEGLDFFTDLMFPFVARACDGVLTEHWIISWRAVPLFGTVAALALERFRFWGCAMIACLLNVAMTGLVGLCGLMQHEQIRKKWQVVQDSSHFRINAEVLFAWARSASTAMMPSVALLCEALADQKKYVYDMKDAKESTDARVKFRFGKIDESMLRRLELQNFEEQERVQYQAQVHYVRLLVAKVFLGNVLSMWLQSSFLALTFEQTGSQAREKVVFSMCVSAVIALVRCTHVTGRIGATGMILSAIIVFFIAWTVAKVHFAYRCKDHVWNLTTGCVDL